jgi:hypothetical protein
MIFLFSLALSVSLLAFAAGSYLFAWSMDAEKVAKGLMKISGGLVMLLSIATVVGTGCYGAAYWQKLSFHQQPVYSTMRSVPEKSPQSALQMPDRVLQQDDISRLNQPQVSPKDAEKPPKTEQPRPNVMPDLVQII